MQPHSNPNDPNDLALLPREHTVDLRELYYAVTDNRFRLIVIALLAAVGFGVLFWFVGVRYESMASIYISTGSDALTYEQIEAGYLMMDDCVEILGSRPVIEATIEKLDIDETYSDFLDRVTIESVPSSHIINITVSHNKQRETQWYANTLLEVGTDRITDFFGSGVVQTVESARFPDKPAVSPVVMGVLVGILTVIFGVGLRVLRFLFSARLVTPGDVETHLGLETFGGLFEKKHDGDLSGYYADSDATARLQGLLMSDETNLDCLRRLRSCILDRSRGRIRSILIAGVNGDEDDGNQRARAAASLAAALTETGRKAVFIDLDRYARAGIMDRLVVGEELKTQTCLLTIKSLSFLNLGRPYVSGGDAGRTRQPALMDQTCFRPESFAELVNLLEERFGYVIVSASDMTPVSDVGRCVDAVVVAVASGSDRAGSVRALHRQLEHAGCRVIGGMLYGLPKTRRVYYSVFGSVEKDGKTANAKTRRPSAKTPNGESRRPSAKTPDAKTRRPAGTAEKPQE